MITPRSSVQLLTSKQQELLVRVAEAGSLPHAGMNAASISALLGRGYIVPTDKGKSVAVTESGSAAYQELLQLQQDVEAPKGRD